MSIHTSLRKAGGKAGGIRNVLKRHERVRLLMAQGLWPEGRAAFGLPKVKQERIKLKKAAPKEAPAEGAAPEASTAPKTPPS